MRQKKYQVFISSTYTDLVEERSKIIEALLSLGCIPVGMENFPAANDDQFTVIKKLISSCDYYVLVIGGRYGSINPDSGRSYTEMEYDYAIESGIPTIAFYHQNMDMIPNLKTDQNSESRKKLEDFITKVQKKLCKAWTSSENLASNVILSLNSLFDTNPRVGWVRGDIISNDEANQTILDLQKENQKLKEDLKRYQSEYSLKKKVLQQHGDIINLKFLSKNELLGNIWGVDLKCEPKSFSISWDDIFKVIGHLFTSPVQTNSAEDRISNALCQFLGLDDDWALETASANTILAQFYALEYLELKTGELYLSGIVSFYVITKQGMNLLVDLMSLKNK